MPSTAPKYFFSYARDDAEFVLRLARELRTAGAHIWVDQLDILGGERWDQAIEAALKSCQGMIVVLSPKSVNSENVMDEVSFALEARKLIVPVIKADCEIPFRLRRLQNIKFATDFNAGLAELLRTLNAQHTAAAGARPPAAADSLLIAPTATVSKESGHSFERVKYSAAGVWKAIRRPLARAGKGFFAAAVLGAFVAETLVAGDKPMPGSITAAIAVWYGAAGALVLAGTTDDAARLRRSGLAAAAVLVMGVALRLFAQGDLRSFGGYVLVFLVPMAAFAGLAIKRQAADKPKSSR